MEEYLAKITRVNQADALGQPNAKLARPCPPRPSVLSVAIEGNQVKGRITLLSRPVSLSRGEDLFPSRLTGPRLRHVGI